MKDRRAKSKWIRLAFVTIVVHTAVSYAHGRAHEQLGIGLSQLQTIYILAVIVLAPLAAGVLLWRDVKKAGAMLLVFSMAGSLIFGVYNHFVAISPDHVFHLTSTTNNNWVLVFQVTAIVLAIVEAIGVWTGLRVLREA